MISRSSWCALAVMTLLVGCAALATDAPANRAAQAAGSAASPTSVQVPPFSRPDDLDARLPTPESVLGSTYGHRAVRYADLKRYLRMLADASPRLTIRIYGESHENRELMVLTVTSEANHARLEEIRSDVSRLADPRGLDLESIDLLAASTPAVAWLAYSIHGDELSPCDAAIEVIYQLAAREDEEARAWRDHMVIHIDPLQNPDGRERFLAQIEAMRGKVENPDIQAEHHVGDWTRGRGNHYLFDLNRDWLMMVHPETQSRAREILRWNPHLLVDSHEMSGLDTYLFDPPREPLNVQLSTRIMQWRRAFSADQAAAFDRNGWSYYTQEWYEEWYPGYTNAWANLLGTVGILYEAAALGSSAVTQASGEVRRYHDAITQNIVSSFANLRTLHDNRTEILRDFAMDRRLSTQPGEQLSTFIMPRPEDRSRFRRFIDLLDLQGIEYVFTDAPATARNATGFGGTLHEQIDIPAGSLLIRTDQPRRRLLLALLEFDPRMSDAFLVEERTDLEQGRGGRIYDITGWNVAMAYGLNAYWAENVSEVPITDQLPMSGQPDLSQDGYGYLIDVASSDVYRALTIMFEHNLKPRAASEPFRVAGRPFKPGSILLRRHEQPDHVHDVILRIVDSCDVDVISVTTALAEEGPDLGGQRFHLLQPPRVAIAAQWPVSTTSFGTYWHLLDDRLGLRASPINVQRLASLDLRKYNVLVLPDAGGQIGAVLGEGGIETLRRWVESGGTLIASGQSAAMLASEETGMSTVRLRRNVLASLDVYGESVERERAARQVVIDSDRLWGHPDNDEQNATDEEPGESTRLFRLPDDPAARERMDRWPRRFSPQGAIVRSEVDTRHWLGFGLDGTLPVLVSEANVFLSMEPASTPVRFLPEQSLRLSGLLWPEARFRTADSAYATVESLGDGQVILFASDPHFRSYFEGTGRLLLNAVLLGPGMGANAPLPW